MTGIVPFDELECPACGAVGTIERPQRGMGVHDEAPLECLRERGGCGRQLVGRRDPLDSVFDFSGR